MKIEFDSEIVNPGKKYSAVQCSVKWLLPSVKVPTSVCIWKSQGFRDLKTASHVGQSVEICCVFVNTAYSLREHLRTSLL